MDTGFQRALHLWVMRTAAPELGEYGESDYVRLSRSLAHSRRPAGATCRAPSTFFRSDHDFARREFV